MHTAAALAWRAPCPPKADMGRARRDTPPNLDTLLHINSWQLRPWCRFFLLKHLIGLMLTHHLMGLHMLPCSKGRAPGRGAMLPYPEAAAHITQNNAVGTKGKAAQQTAARLQGTMAPPPALAPASIPPSSGG